MANINIAFHELKEAIERSLPRDKEWLTLKEAASEFNLSTSFLYQLTSQRKLAFYKPSGKLIYFKRSEIEQWIATSRVKTLVEIQSEVSNAAKEERRHGK